MLRFRKIYDVSIFLPVFNLYHQATGNEVVQSLFFFGKEGHKKAYEQGHPTEYFGKETPRCFTKAKATAV